MYANAFEGVTLPFYSSQISSTNNKYNGLKEEEYKEVPWIIYKPWEVHGYI